MKCEKEKNNEFFHFNFHKDRSHTYSQPVAQSCETNEQMKRFFFFEKGKHDQ